MNLNKYIFSTSPLYLPNKNSDNTFFMHIFVNAKKCLVMKKIYILAILVLNIVCSQAQITVSTTHPFNTPSNVGMGVQIHVQNTNSYPVRVFRINTLNDVKAVPFAQTFNVWFKPNATNAAPGAITTANGWTFAGSFVHNQKFNSNTPLISNLAIDIPANSTYRLWIFSTNVIGLDLPTVLGVNTFTNAGVNIMTGDSISWWGTSLSGTNITPQARFVGDVEFYPLIGCTGAPEVGDIVGINNSCPNEAKFYYLQNYISGNNITYQWQFATSPAGVYTNIAGNNTTMLARTAPAVNQYYRCIATCGTSTLKDTTPVFADTINPFYYCYCASGSTQAGANIRDNIDSVVFADLRNGDPSCALYSNYRATKPITKLRCGTTVPVDVTHKICNFTNITGLGLSVFADLNRNGVFDVTETAGAGNTIPFGSIGGGRYTSNLTIPLASPLGITGLRVVMNSNSTAPPTTACGNFTWGETEDYLIQIIKDSTDAKFNSIINLESGCSLGNTNISFNASNIGINAITPLPVCYSVNGGTPVCENLAILAIGATANYTFATQANLAGAGPKTIKIWHNNPLDTNKTNDTLFKTIINFPTPPDPIAQNDTVCVGYLQSILKAPSYDSFLTRWYTDIATTNEIGQGNQLVLQGGTVINQTRYAKSVYTYTTNFGPTIFSPETNVNTTGQGLIFDVLRNKVQINSVLMKFANAGLGAIEVRSPANVVIFTKSFVVKSAGIQRVDVGVTLPIGTGYRMLLNTNPGLTVATTSYTSFPQLIPTVISITNSTTASQYNFFYDWNITYDACASNVVPVTMTYIGSTVSPTKTLFKDTFFCEYPDTYLDAKNSGSTYKWHDNSTNQTIKLTNSGLYIVTITNSIGCRVVDTSKIKINKSPIFSLGNDTTVCSGHDAKLKSGFSNAGYNHVWSTGSLEPEITVNSEGTYIVNVFNTNTNCGYSDTAKVKYKASPYAFIGRDTFACNQTPITIYAPYNINYLYSWNNGTPASKNDTLINSKGRNKVWVEITDISNAFGCKSSDTAIIKIANLSKPNLGLDKTSCNPQEIIGLTQNDTLTYRWNTGETTNTVKTSNSGTYILTVTEVGTTCSFSDTIKLTFIPSPPLDLGPDITTCNKSPITLKANPGWTSYAWSNGFNLTSITVNTSNTYTVTATNSCGTLSDNITITYLDTVVAFNLPNDMPLVCSPVSLTVPSQVAPNIINWSTGETTNTISVNKTGNYWVSISNSCGAKSDAIYIKFDTIPTPNYSEQFAGTFLAFANKSLNAVSYKWYFGDDSVSTDVNPTHRYLKTGTYQVKLVATNSCGDSVSLTKSISIYNSGVNTLNLDEVSIFPNPSSDKFIIQLIDKTASEYSIELLSIDGRRIKSQSSKSNSENQLQLDINEIAVGTYWLKLTDKNKNQIIKNVTISR